MKKAKRNSGIMIVVSIAIVIIAGLFFFAPATTQSVTGNKAVCESTTSPNLSIKAVDKETGVAITEATNLYRIKGETAWSTFTAGTGFSVDALEEIEIVMGISTTDFTDNAYGQYIESYKVPCKETPSEEFEMANDEVETSLTATFYNNDGDAGAETFVAGQTQDVSIKLQAGVDEFFGNPYLPANSNVLCVALNTTEWDTPEKVSIKNGAELSKVSTPIRQASASGITNYCYEMPVISEDQVEIVLKLNADDSTAPATDMTATMYASNYFYNADNQGIDYGVENEEGTAVGTDAGDTVTLDFTA